jgi:hypothetical protein
MFRTAGVLPGPNTRELCQSVCSSATCLIPRPSRIYASICRASGHQRKSCSPLIGRPDGREVSRSSTTPIARSQPFKGRPLAVSEARPREDRPPGPRPGGFSSPRPGGAPSGFSSPRPGGFSPRPSEGGGPPGSRSRNFGPDAPPKNKRKPPRKDSDRGPKGPIKERPVSRIYDADEDWRAKDDLEEVEVDNVATSAKKDEAAADDETVGDDET